MTADLWQDLPLFEWPQVSRSGSRLEAGGNPYAAAAPPAARYRYLLTDLMSGKVLSDGRGLSVQSYARRLCTQGEASATWNVSEAALRLADDPIVATEPRRTALWIIRNEQVVYGGIIWTRQYRSDAAQLSLGLATFESYYARRRIRATLSYTQQDQNQIIYRLLTDATSKAYGNIGAVLPAPANSGVLRDRYYYWHERATYFERMQQLAQVIGGPDFTFEPGWISDGVPGVTLRVGTPIGSAVPTVVEYPGEIRNYTWPDDGGDSANFWTAIGDAPSTPDDAPPVMRDASVPAEWAVGVPLLEDVSEHQGVTDAATLSAYAQANVKAAAGNRVVPEVTLRLQPDSTLPGLGNTLQMRVSDPYRFPPNPYTGGPGAVMSVRITGYTVNISNDEGETLTVVTGDDL
jgi:hypothetical protein